MLNRIEYVSDVYDSDRALMDSYQAAVEQVKEIGTKLDNEDVYKRQVFVLSVAYCMSRLRFKMRKPFMNLAMILGLFPAFMSMAVSYTHLQKYWQVLPVGPTIFGDSPYQPSSGCAGNI